MDANQKTLLPVLQALVNKTSSLNNINLSQWLIICIQHTLLSTVDLLQSLLMCGAVPDQMFLLGKHYSYCEQVYRQLEKLGIHTTPLVSLEKYGQFRKIYGECIISFWNNIHEKLNKSNIIGNIILDDGGVNFEYIFDCERNLNPTVGIEQTSAGSFYLREHELKMPVISVAASAIKVFLEAPLIAEAIVNKLQDRLNLKVTTRPLK